MLYLPSWCLRVGSRIPAKHVQVFVEPWYTHSRNVWSLFIWITVVVTVTITHKTADVRQQNPLSLICKVQMFKSCCKNIYTLVSRINMYFSNLGIWKYNLPCTHFYFHVLWSIRREDRWYWAKNIKMIYIISTTISQCFSQSKDSNTISISILLIEKFWKLYNVYEA